MSVRLLIVPCGVKCHDGFNPSAIRGGDRFRRIAGVAARRDECERYDAGRST